MPAAIAPEETITTSEPAFIRDSMASASWASLPASNSPDSVVSAVVPILTTTLRAVRIASRWVAHRPLVRGGWFAHRPLVRSASVAHVSSPPCSRRWRRSSLRSAAPTRSLCSRRASVPRPVGVTSTPAGGLRLPLESHLADGHRAAGLGAALEQRLLDTEPGEPVAEVADRLVVVEVGLGHPAFRAAAATTKPPGWSVSAATVKPLSSTGTGRITGRRGTTGGNASW